MIKPKLFIDLQKEAEDKQIAGNYYERSLLFEDLPLEGLETIWEASRNYPSGSEGTLLLATCGGGDCALAEVSPEATVFPFRKASLWLVVFAKWYGNLILIL
jgi:hypothetical protein